MSSSGSSLCRYVPTILLKTLDVGAIFRCFFLGNIVVSIRPMRNTRVHLGFNDGGSAPFLGPPVARRYPTPLCCIVSRVERHTHKLDIAILFGGEEE